MLFKDSAIALCGNERRLLCSHFKIDSACMALIEAESDSIRGENLLYVRATPTARRTLWRQTLPAVLTNGKARELQRGLQVY